MNFRYIGKLQSFNERLEGLLSFALGFVLAIVPPLLGRFMPALYDHTLLPFFYKIVRPLLWVPAVAAAALLLWRTEKAGFIRDIGLLVSGLVFGLMLAHDWWYLDSLWFFVPWCLCLLLPLVAWRLRVMFWSRPKTSVIAVSLLAGLLLVGALLDFPLPRAELDNRFSPGLGGTPNYLITLSVVGAAVMLLVTWGLWHFANGEARNRALMTEIINREPRCGAYFDAVARVTGHPAPPFPEKRFASVANAAVLAGMPAVFREETGAMNKFGAFMRHSASWKVGTVLSHVPGLRKAAAWLREPARTTGMNSVYFRALLVEAARVEHGRYLARMLAGVPADQNPLRHFHEYQPDFADANRHFALMATLREANLEACHSLFHGVPQLSDAELGETITRWLARLDKPDAGAPQNPAETSRQLVEMEAGYFALWADNIDRLFLQQGHHFQPLTEKDAPVDFRALTRILLVLRNANARGSESIHERAANLSLSLFLLDEKLAETVGTRILQRYFDVNNPSAPLRAELSPADARHAGIAAAGWGLYLGGIGDWQKATLPLFIHAIAQAAAAHPQIARIVAHLRAGAFLHQAARRPKLPGGNPLDEVVGLYRGLPDVAESDLVPHPPIPAKIVVCFFARNYLGALDPALLEQARRHLLQATSGTRWERAPIYGVLPTGLVEMPRFPIRAALAWYAVAFFGAGVVLFGLMRNPVHRVRDPRMGTRYDNVPLNCIAANHGHDDVWVGSSGSGIRVYDPANHLFRKDINRKNNTGLLSDNVLDLDFGPVKTRLAAVNVTAGPDGAGGVQICSSDFPPVFWNRPILDLQTFPGIDDKTAKCVISSADLSYLLIGTAGHGVGVYSVAEHSWKEHITAPALPSSNIRDLATSAQPGAQLAVWIATDKGLCGGWLRDGGKYEPQWKYSRAEGLAGDAIQKLVIGGGYLWYLTDNHGFGRIALDENGAPLPAVAPELLITERSVPGFADDGILFAKGSAAAPVTWFLGGKNGEMVAARYREQPHDLFGLKLPADFPMTAVKSLATEANGTAMLAATGTGSWYFAEGNPDDPTTEPGRAPMTGGFAGPENVSVTEAAIAGPEAILRSVAQSGTSTLLHARRAAELPWKWNTLIGPGRFPGLLGAADITASAASATAVYFGTKGKGIGVWDRARLELRQEMHSTLPVPGGKLRDDTTLDLAMAGNTLVQVTGDNALDTIEGGQVSTLIPADEAPFPAQSVVAATARGSFFVGASADKVGVYDLATCSWKELASPGNVARLDVSSDLVWALTTAKTLHFCPLGGGQWFQAAENVSALAASPDAAYVLTQAAGKAAAIRAFRGNDGAELFAHEPEPLARANGNWKHAVELGNQLFLAGSDRALHAYSLTTRKWQSIPFQAGMGNVSEMFATAQSVWIVDAERRLHRYLAGGGVGTFESGLENGVERVTSDAQRVVVQLRGAPERIVERADGDDSRRVVVGTGFPGQLSQIGDALDWKGNLVVGQGPNIARYDWAHHHWEKLTDSIGDVRRFFTNAGGLHLWVETSKGLFASQGEEFLPVLADGNPLRTKEVAVGGDTLHVLDTDGRIWTVSAATPAEAQLRIAADSIRGGLPRDAAQITPFGSSLAALTGDGVSFFGPLDGLPRWTPAPLPTKCSRIVADMSGTTLLAHDSKSAYFIRLDGGKPVVRSVERTGGNIAAAAVTRDSAAIATQTAGEEGLRVSFHTAGPGTPIIGAALPRSAATRKAFALSDGNLLRLDEGGNTAVYDTAGHSWQAENAGPFADAWQIGPGLAAFQPTKKTLHLRTDTWRPEGTTAGLIETVERSGDGLLMKLAGGGYAWRTGEATGRVTPPSSKGAPRFGRVLDAAEIRGALVICDDSGGVAAFDWMTQNWNRVALPEARKFLTIPEGIFVIAGKPDRFTLHGPLQLEGSTLVARPVTGTAPLRHGIAGAGENHFLGVDGAIYQLGSSGLVKWWADAAKPASNAVFHGGTFFVMRGDGAYRITRGAADGRPVAEPLPPLPDAARTVMSGLMQVLSVGLGPLADDGFPKGTAPLRVVQIETAEGIVARVSDDKFYALGDGEWRLLNQAPARVPEPPVAAEKMMASWHWVPQQQDPNRFQRRFDSGNWRPLHLAPEGFGLDKPLGAAVSGNNLNLRTRAGVLVYQPGSEQASDLLPDDPQAQPPGPVQNPAGMIFENADWKWERPIAGGTETVTWRTITSQFDPASGRFGWDHCTGVGQAGGDAWAVTRAGLFKITAGGVDPASRWIPPADAGRLGFLDTSNDLPGALAPTGSTAPAYRYDSAWKPVDNEARTRLQNLRGASAHWRVTRDGGISRSVPQAPGTFHSTRVDAATGRWDFESCTAITATDVGAHLATSGGVGLAKVGGNGLTGWWPEFGAVTAIGESGGQVAALTAKGPAEYEGAVWKNGTRPPPAKTAPLVSKGARFHVERRFPGASISVMRAKGQPPKPVSYGRQGFAFDEVSAVQPVNGGAVTAITAEGPVDFSTDGDMEPSGFPAASSDSSVEFLRVAVGEAETAIFAKSSRGSLRYDGTWRPLDAQAAEALASNRSTLVHGARWLIKQVGGEVQFRLRAAGDQAGRYKPVSFVPASGLFTFDVFTAIATPDAEGNLAVGSAGGIESVRMDGELRRLWCEPAEDGIGAVIVKRLVRDEAGALQIQIATEGGNLQLPREGGKAAPSTPAKFQAALAITASEPEGWRVEISRENNIPLRIGWKAQPVFLINGRKGGSRFAHNVVHSVLADGAGRLLLGTAGGLVVLPSAKADLRTALSVVSQPFLRGGTLGTPIEWLGANGAEQIVARAQGGGGAWRIPADNPSGAQSVTAAELDAAMNSVVATDDVLEWRHPQAGRSELKFVSGKSSPANLDPAVIDGTFAFLQLPSPRPGAPSHTITSLGVNLVWLSRAGVVRFDTGKREFLHLHAEFGNARPGLDVAGALVSGVRDGQLYVKAGSDTLAFDSSSNPGRWTAAQGKGSPFAEPNLAAYTPLFEVHQENSKARLVRHVGDDPAAPFFSDGRATLDNVSDFHAPVGAGGALQAATTAGVAEFSTDTFACKALFAAAFPTSGGQHPVREIATAAPAETMRTVARANDGTTFEFRDARWTAAAGVSEVFETSYRKVNDPARWTWSRYADGLTCTLLKTNGPPLRLGEAVDPSAPPIFSRGKLAIDDARGVALTEGTLHVLTPVGLLRFDLAGQNKAASFAGLDVWSENHQETLVGLTGIGRDDGFAIWGNDRMFTTTSHDSRGWQRSAQAPTAASAVRVTRDQGNLWNVRSTRGSNGSDLEVRFTGGLRNSTWHVPSRAFELRETGTSDHGLWILTDRELVHAQQSRIQLHLRHFFSGGFGK